MEFHHEKTLDEFILPDYFSESEVAAAKEEIKETENEYGLGLLGFGDAEIDTYHESMLNYYHNSECSSATASVSSSGSLASDKDFPNLQLDIKQETDILNFGADDDMQLFVPTNEHELVDNGPFGFGSSSDYYSGSSPDEDEYMKKYAELIRNETRRDDVINLSYDINGEMLDKDKTNSSSFPFEVGNEVVVSFDENALSEISPEENSVLRPVRPVSSPIHMMPNYNSVLSMADLNEVHLPTQTTIDQTVFGELLRFDTSNHLADRTSFESTSDNDLIFDFLNPEYASEPDTRTRTRKRKKSQTVNNSKRKLKSTSGHLPEQGRKRKVESDGVNSSTNKTRKRKVESDGVNSSTNITRKRVLDVNSFRYQIGPHLRIMSSVFTLTGLKIVLDDVSYEVVRRFHPTDLYSTIYKSMIPREHYKQVTMKEPDWSLWEANLQHEVEGDRIYFRSPFGNEGGTGQLSNKSLVSLPKNFEIDGKLNYAPETLCCVGSADLNVNVDMTYFAGTCTNVELKDNKYLHMTLKDPKSSGILYPSGKLIVIGCKSYPEFRSVTRKFARMIQKAGYDVNLTNLKSHYYIGIAKLPFNINLACLTKHHGLLEGIKFDLSAFPGVALFIESMCVMCFICGSGSVLIKDAVKPEDLKMALDKIYPCLKQFAYN